MSPFAFAVAFLSLTFVAPAPAADLAATLEKSRAAFGYEARRAETGLVRFEGKTRRNGFDGTHSLLFARDGRFVHRFEDRLGVTFGFDGREVWSVDETGLTRVLDLGDRETALFATWVATGFWLEPDGPFRIEADPSSSEAGGTALRLALKDGRTEGTLRLSPETGLPAALERVSTSGLDTWRYEDYDRTLGFAFPRRITRTSGTLTTAIETASFARAAAPAGDPFAYELAPAPNARFEPGVPPRLDSMRTRTGHTLVRAAVNGKDVGWFIFDSGAGGMVIDGKAAEAAAMPKFGDVVAVGIGGPVATSFRQCQKFEVGPLVMTGAPFTELDLAFLTTAFGVPIGGICGYDVFGRAVVDFDTAAGTIDLHDPATFDGAGLPFQEVFLMNKVPGIRCRFEGDREEIFRLDTGAQGSLAFHGPAVKRLSLLEGRETSAGFDGGVGGLTGARKGRLAWFELGGKRFENLEVSFSLAEKGAFSESISAGNVGGDILKSFRLVFDYPRKRIALLPAAPAGAGGEESAR